MNGEAVAILAFATLFIGCMGLAWFVSPRAQLKRQERRAEQEERAREVARKRAEDEERRRRFAIERREKVVDAVMASMWWWRAFPLLGPVLIISMLATAWYLFDGRYSYSRDGNSSFRIDRLTGEVCKLYNSDSSWNCR